MLPDLEESCVFRVKTKSLEHLYSQKTVEALEINLGFFKEIFQGSSAEDSVDLQSFLTSVDEEDQSRFAKNMVKSFTRRIESVPRGDKLSLSLFEAEINSCQSEDFCHLQASAKQLSDWVKGPLIGFLGKRKPLIVQGDND